MLKLRLTVLIFIICNIYVYSQIELPSVFGNNMVLQQKEKVPIWGKDLPNTHIKIKTSWGSTAKTTADVYGNWRVSIKTKKASFDPQTLEIIGSNTLILNNILIGEVWFCSGQSNMEMPLTGFSNSKVLNSEKFSSNANNIRIRLFNNPRSASVLPSTKIGGEWAESNTENAKNFSAIGYIFGTKLYENLNVPIGIIESAWGGTRIESWIPKEKLTKYLNIKFFDDLPIEENKQKKPSFLYNAMIYPFQDFKVKGILWYQGESNRNEPDPYKNYMEDLINSWRTQWKDNKLPFYFVQIAPYSYEKHRKTPKLNADLIREAQLQISQEMPKTGLVVTTDAGDCDDIHPSKKGIVAKRLANWALAEQYHLKDINFKSPVYKSINIKGNQAILSFKFYRNDSFVLNEKLFGFTISGVDKKFYPATAKINKDNKSITLYSEHVENPVAVRYGFQDCFENGIKTNSGLPISVFRTDNW